MKIRITKVPKWHSDIIEQESAKAKEAFEALTPEEQTALMQRAAQEEQMAQAAAQQQTAGQAMPEEAAMMQQEMMADGSQPMLGQEPEMMAAEGGHLYPDGGKLYEKLFNALDVHTVKGFKDWAKKNNVPYFTQLDNDDVDLDKLPWETLMALKTFRKGLAKTNPALADALEKGYDFGTYKPSNKDKATIQSISRGNWKATDGKGWFGSEDLAYKQATKGLSESEIKALTTEQLAERMRGTNAYKNTSNWLKNKDNALLYLNTLLNDPDTPEVAKKHALQYVKDGQWKDGYDYSYDDVFGKVRATNPGTYWHTAMEANRGNQAGNFVINEDGSVESIIGDVPTDWTPAGNYNWSDENNDYAYNYYKRPVVASPTSSPETPAETPEKEEKGVAPKHKAEWLRYAGLFGPAVGLGLQMAGVGRPDTGSIDAAITGAGDVSLASYKPLGNYLTYRPLDIWYANNRATANARATDRALINTSGANRGTAMAGLLANGYNSQLASGELFRQAQEYNDNLKKQVAEFNRGTDQFNAEAFNRNSQFNAEARNRAIQQAAQLRLHAAQQKSAMDADWYNGIYGNVAGLFKGLGDLGTENYRMNRISEMAADGLFGNLGESYTGKSKVKKKAKGGKVKRGLTY